VPIYIRWQSTLSCHGLLERIEEETCMDEIHLRTKDTLTQTIAHRIENLWAAYERGDAVAHNAILSDDYRAIRPDGTLHPRKPTAQEIAPALIDQYSLTQLQAVPIGHDGALAP
jgi:hypothetical protein